MATASDCHRVCDVLTMYLFYFHPGKAVDELPACMTAPSVFCSAKEVGVPLIGGL